MVSVVPKVKGSPRYTFADLWVVQDYVRRYMRDQRIPQAIEELKPFMEQLGQIRRRRVSNHICVCRHRRRNGTQYYLPTSPSEADLRIAQHFWKRYSCDPVPDTWEGITSGMGLWPKAQQRSFSKAVIYRQQSASRARPKRPLDAYNDVIAKVHQRFDEQDPAFKTPRVRLVSRVLEQYAEAEQLIEITSENYEQLRRLAGPGQNANAVIEELIAKEKGKRHV